MQLSTVEELQTFLASSSINERMNWARETLINNDGWLTFTVPNLIDIGDDLVAANCRSWGSKQKRSARLTFTRHDSFLWSDIVYNRALRQTSDSYFSSMYRNASESFRHATDASIIEIVYAVSRKLMDAKDEYNTVYEFRDCADKLFEHFELPRKPDQRRSIQAILLLARMFPGREIKVGDFEWQKQFSELLPADSSPAKLLRTQIEDGIAWQPTGSSHNETGLSYSYTSLGLSAGNRSEIRIVFENCNRAHADAMSNILDAGTNIQRELLAGISDILKRECIYYGVDVQNVQRDIRLYLREKGYKMDVGTSLSMHMPLAGSVFPQAVQVFKVDLTHESLHNQPVEA
ncbi:hypothetical protein HOV30_gp130 [Erwinia phage Derbicus]|uniref:Uncharacterized protein n=2 Tax=Derbicusvirus derbicus TaxID=2734104 RepID=A0A482IHX3_9CAUD|nr:hypothetical protein BIZ82_gp130 [Erwinia phage vB_EamM_EarlPhillipIV]YP_009821174.1 hypothetical protein HOV30_gp130 [Erwinia phage Derbicus]ANZ48979.1 hypothetical protein EARLPHILLIPIV_130 [Erwinia phage vB_EamM_EarlPhillipIV]QBP07556.1 hypothetical protein DERBICUS_130 [Erwinia phage Derbicus]